MEASEKPLIAWFLPALSPRVEFVIRTLCAEWLDIPFWIGTPSDTPPQTPYRIACGCQVAGALHLSAHALLWLRETPFFLPKWNEEGLFPTQEGDYPYDLLAMAFYVLSLYPLYEWPYDYDTYGLYRWERLPFYEAKFWSYPFLQVHWYRILDLLGYPYEKPPFAWEVGWDIDHPYAWKGRVGLRWWIGGLRRGDLHKRILAQLGKLADPYDTHEEIIRYFPPLHARFFMLVSDAHRLDSLVSPTHPFWRKQIQRLLEKGYAVGLHPSYRTREEPARLQAEKTLLESYTGSPVYFSRQHYLRYFWPDTFYHLAAAGIREDYSLAFPERSGFLLGTALPTSLYDASREKPLPLRFHPVALMDQVYLRRGDRVGLAQEIQRLYAAVSETGGKLHFIWHNSTWEAAEPLRHLIRESRLESNLLQRENLP
jgi:hypothetical protein